MVPKPKPLVVDSNCFIRLLDWGPRPLVGQTIGGFRLVTTEKLVRESQTPDLQEKYPKLGDPGIQRELKAAAQKFPPKQQKAIREETDEFHQQANRVVTVYCTQRKTEKMRGVSYVDASLWATAVHIEGAVATDEWPLALAAQQLPYNDDGDCIEVYTSVHLLHMLESEGKLQPAERWNMVRQWRRAGEMLHRDADKHYKQLFGEVAPTAKSPAR